MGGGRVVGRSPTFAFWRKVGYQAYTGICNHLISECGQLSYIAHSTIRWLQIQAVLRTIILLLYSMF